MVKLTNPKNEFYSADKKPLYMQISKRKLGKNPPTHNLKFINSIRKTRKKKTKFVDPTKH